MVAITTMTRTSGTTGEDESGDSYSARAFAA